MFKIISRKLNYVNQTCANKCIDNFRKNKYNYICKIQNMRVHFIKAYM